MGLFRSIKKLAGKAAPLVGGYFGGAFGAQAGKAIGGKLNKAKSQPNMTAQQVEIVPSAADSTQSFNTSSPIQSAVFTKDKVENAGGVENASGLSNKNLPLIGVGLLAVYVLAKGAK